MEPSEECPPLIAPPALEEYLLPPEPPAKLIPLKEIVNYRSSISVWVRNHNSIYPLGWSHSGSSFTYYLEFVTSLKLRLPIEFPPPVGNLLTKEAPNFSSSEE